MDGLCKSFISSGDYQDISKVHSAIEALSNRLHKLTSNYRFNVGDAPESILSKSIRSIIKALEDLLLNAMEGTDVNNLACRGLLLYQVAPDIML